VNASAKTLILVNPVAGGGRARNAQRRVAEYLRGQGVQAEFVESRSAEGLRPRAAEAAAAGYGRIAALGGDGSFQQVVKATLGSEAVLGFLPAGGGNDIAEALGIPQEPVAAAYVFLHGQPRRMDVLRAHFTGGHAAVYVGGGGLGLDAEAAGLANGKFRRLPGAARYVAGALWALATFEPFLIEVELDGQSIAGESGPVIFAAVANTPTYGAGVKIAPTAETDDGLLDVILVRALPWTRLVELIPVVLRTGDIRAPEVRRFRARRVRLETNRPALFHGDGEVLGEAPVEIETLPGAIRVLAPARK
jgi:diacylglycerol kinase (ATP)